jgi:hypothetical protein
MMRLLPSGQSVPASLTGIRDGHLEGGDEEEAESYDRRNGLAYAPCYVG